MKDKILLGDFANIDSGFAFKSSLFNESQGIKLIRIRDVDVGYTNTYYAGEYDESYIVNNGDMLITMDGEFRIKCWSGERALLNQRVCRISSVNDNLYNRYLYYLLPRYLKEIEDRTPFVTVKHLSVKDISQIQIILPSIDVQYKIVHVLDKAQELIDKRKEQIEALDEFIRSVFLDMFGDPVSNTHHYNVEQLGNIISFLTSGSRGWAQYYSKSGELFITIKNVKNGKLDLTDATYVTAPCDKEAERTKVKEGDLLISITADLGRTAVVDKHTANKGAYINQHLCIARLDKKVNPVYISAFLESRGGEVQFERLNQVGVKSGLNFNSIRSLSIVIPPLDLQNKFAEIVHKTEQQKELLQRSLIELENNFKSIMHRSFSG